ncbi:MAG: hypothetical protein ACM3NF_02485 [Gemmatimonadota bacterium]
MGLVARHVEAAGIPTLCMTSALDITRAVNPPRAAFLDFPLGHTAGAPNDPELQRSILVEALSSFATMTAPGSVKMLPHRWPGDGGWKARAFAGGDERRPRHETPQYQCEEDRRRAERGVAPACPACRS